MREAPALAVAADRMPARPRPAPARPRTPAGRQKSKPPSLLRRAFARPGVTVAGAVFAAVMTGIVTNAVFFQKGQHPSPLFGGQAVSDHADVPTPPRRVAEIAPAPVVPRPLPQPDVDPVVPPAPAIVQRAPVVAATTRPRHAAAVEHKAISHGDQIGKLLAETGVPAAKPPGSKAADAVKKPHAPVAKKTLASAAGATQQ